MFELQYFWIFWLVQLHIFTTCFSIYVHRSVAHRHFLISKPLGYFFRIVLWISGTLGPNWAETYTSRHRKHHATSDTKNDDQSPHHLTLKQMCQPWKADQDEVKKYCPDIQTPDDWMQKTLHEKYRFAGPWVQHLVAGILFGYLGAVLSLVLHLLTKNWLGVFIGNYAFHKFGFDYAGHKNLNDKSKNLFPIGILLGGEELHNNHHNMPYRPNYRHRWFEVDIGYVYAKIFSMLGLLTISEEKNEQPRKSLG